jgi:hypothetical protein
VQISFFESVHPPPLIPRWATALNFVIPTAADPVSRIAIPCKATYAASASRMNFANAAKLGRKSG